MLSLSLWNLICWLRVDWNACPFAQCHAIAARDTIGNVVIGIFKFARVGSFVQNLILLALTFNVLTHGALVGQEWA